jgi:hypothetical protein
MLLAINNEAKALFMTTTGDVAKSILIFCCGYFIFLMIGQAITGQTALTVFMLLVS